MEFDIAVKVETVDEKCDTSMMISNAHPAQKQNQHEIAGGEGIAEIKTEPEPSVCESNLYVDHQVKDEVVIGPTELHKQSGGSFQDPSLFVCNICMKFYKHKGSFTRHLNTHHSRAASGEKCEQKDEKRKIKNNKQEQSVLNGKKKVIQKITGCKDEAIKNVELEEFDNNNANLKTDNSQNKCLLCLKKFTITANLMRHMKQFHGDKVKKTFFCDKCPMSFSRSDYLIRHKLIKHSEGKQIINCRCGNKFYNKWSYTRHRKGYCILKTSKPVKLICDYCNKTFCNKYRLTEHIKKHLKNTYKTLICEYCNKHFHRKFEIERHMLQHLGVCLHKFKCKICNKKFTRNWSLKKHLISHTGKKPFTCRYCLRAFASQWGCACHERRCR